MIRQATHFNLSLFKVFVIKTAMNLKSFQSKLTIALMSVVLITVGAALTLARVYFERSLERSISENFTHSARYFSLIHDHGVDEIKQKSLALSHSVRLIAALDAKRTKSLYSLVEDEFHLREGGSKTQRSVIIIDENGNALIPENRTLAHAKRLEKAFQSMPQDTLQSLTYLNIESPNGVELREYVLTRIIDPVDEYEVGGLIIGFPTEKIEKTGLFFDSRLYHFDTTSRVSLEKAITRALAKGNKFLETIIESVPYRVSLRAISDTTGNPAYLVSFYSLANAKTRRTKLTLVFLISGTGLLLFGFLMSRSMAKNLSDPITALVYGAQKITQGNLGHQLLVQRNDEIGTLTKTFNLMSVELQKNRESLLDYSKNLELKVEQRTTELRQAHETIQAMIDSVGQGFLTCDKQGQILPTFSKACITLLGDDPSLSSFPSIFGAEQEQEELRSWLEMVFDEPLPFEDIVALGPQVLPKVEDKFVTLEYHAQRDEHGTINGLVIVATDKTDARKAREEAEQERAYTRSILSIANSKAQVIEFINYTRSRLTNFANTLSANNLNRDMTHFELHTIKGGAATYGLRELATLTHELESTNTLEDLPEYIQKARQSIEQFVSRYEAILGKWVSDGEQRIELKVPELIAFREELQDPYLKKYFSEHFIAQRAEDIFMPFDTMLQSLAKELDKELNTLIVLGGDTKIDPTNITKILATFPHLLRNAVDHGIETPNERQRANKPRAGTIRIEVDSNGSSLKISVNDDGKGISAETIRAKLDDTLELNDEEVIQLVFDAGLSTQNTVNEISGRGIGMSAIKDAVDESHGNIRISSREGLGCTTVIEIPIR